MQVAREGDRRGGAAREVQKVSEKKLKKVLDKAGRTC